MALISHYVQQLMNWFYWCSMKIRSDREKSSKSSKSREPWCGASELVGEDAPWDWKGTRCDGNTLSIMSTWSPIDFNLSILFFWGILSKTGLCKLHSKLTQFGDLCVLHKYLIKYNAELLPLHVKKPTQRKCARRNEKLSQHVIWGEKTRIWEKIYWEDQWTVQGNIPEIY